MRKNLILLINAAVSGAAFLVLLLSLGGFVPQLHWSIGWYSNPRPHFLFVSACALIWLAYQKKWKLACMPSAAFLINLVVLLPFFLPNLSQNNDLGLQTLSILHLNTNKGAADLETLSRYPADILFLQEITPELEAQLESELPDYQIALSHPLSTTQGITMLVNKTSPFKTEFHTVRHLPWYNYRPLITTKLELNGKRLHLMSLHTSRPFQGHADLFQQLEVDAAAEWSRIEQDFGHEVVLIGDLNLTPWSTRYKQLLEASQTQDSMRGFGIQNSWTEIVPQWLGLPIDHALVSEGLLVLERQTAPVAGSDHGLLFVKLTTNHP
ncbi:MAG: endonuclease/exonuclease/phosphatase family protein [Anaerolineae bacterium]